MRRLIAVVGISALLLSASAQRASTWRGPTGDGNYEESGLLKQWPSDGPEILWVFEELGQGHSSAVVDQGFVYATGMIGGKGFLFKFDTSGKLVYKKEYGPEYTESYYGTRGTPAIMGDKIYIYTGLGKLYCLHNETGDILWTKDLFRDFDGRPIQWGMNETPVVDGKIIYITPGGRQNGMVALNRHTGDLVWSSPGTGERTAYCTPLLFEHNGRKILATHFESNLVGFDAVSGKMLWKQPHSNQWSVHPNTPIYHEGRLFYLSGYGSGGGMLELSQDGNSVRQIWTHKKMDSRMGGAVLVDGHIYGSGDSRYWVCYDWESGEEKYASRDLGHGVVIVADGMLYCYSQRGELALVEPDPSGFHIVSQSRVSHGSEQHWAHPVIYDGVLYLRHGSALVAYKVKQGV